jgi:hypothetical protein
MKMFGYFNLFLLAHNNHLNFAIYYLTKSIIYDKTPRHKGTKEIKDSKILILKITLSIANL